jgi:hypothetical protein
MSAALSLVKSPAVLILHPCSTGDVICMCLSTAGSTDPASVCRRGCHRYASVYSRQYRSCICSTDAPQYHASPIRKWTIVAYKSPQAAKRRPLVSAAGHNTIFTRPRLLHHVHGGFAPCFRRSGSLVPRDCGGPGWAPVRVPLVVGACVGPSADGPERTLPLTDADDVMFLVENCTATLRLYQQEHSIVTVCHCPHGDAVCRL